MFDARLILPGPAPDIIGGASTFANMLRSSQAAGLEQAHEQRTLADLMKRQQHETGLLDLLSKAGPAPQARLSALQADPRFLAESMKLESHNADVGAKDAARKTALAKQLQEGREWMAKLFHGTKDEADYQRRLAPLPKEERDQLPPTWEAAKPFVDAYAISPEKRLDVEEKDKDRTAAEKRAHILAGTKREAADFDAVTNLRKEVNKDPLIAKYRKSSAELSSLKELAKTSTGANDMALVFAFMKAMDPESVVRESEYAAAEAAGKPTDRMAGLVSKWWTGGRLSANQKAAMVSAAEAAQSGHKTAYEKARKTYDYTAKKRNYDPAEVGLDDESPTGGWSDKDETRLQELERKARGAK